MSPAGSSLIGVDIAPAPISFSELLNHILHLLTPPTKTAPHFRSSLPGYNLWAQNIITQGILYIWETKTTLYYCYCFFGDLVPINLIWPTSLLENQSYYFHHISIWLVTFSMRYKWMKYIRNICNLHFNLLLPYSLFHFSIFPRWRTKWPPECRLYHCYLP